MPNLLKSVSKGYYRQNSIKRESKDMMAIIESNLKKKNALAEKEEKPTEGGVVKRQLKKFDKKIRDKAIV
jgi:hypothetical protein